MELFELSVLCAVALATAVLSAIVGMAGGIVLLSVMLLFMEPLVAIPLHGVIQLVSNSTRAVIQRKHADWSILLWYGALLIPMGFAGIHVARALPAEVLRLAIGLFVLLATWLPGALLLGTHPEQIDKPRRFFALGGVLGFLNVTIGATGPLLAPFFLNLGLTRQTLIGTKAAVQALGHLVKIGLFGVLGFAFAPFAGSLVLLCVAVVVGTWLGSRILEHVSELWFIRLYKTVLTVIALRLVVWEGLALAGWT